MPNDLTHVFVPFADVIKTTVKTSDGIERPARILRGIMTEEKLDLDQQIVDYDWAKKAAGDWFSKWANIREQHTSNAIGKGKEIEFDDANRRIVLTSKIVDADAIVKIDEDIYSGYSIGIKGAGVVKDSRAPEGRINRGVIIEDSIVDHPALETAKFAVVKMRKDGQAEFSTGVEPLEDDDVELLSKVALPSQEKLVKGETQKDSVIDDLVADIDGLNKPNTNPPKKRGAAAPGSSPGEQLEVTPDSAVARRKKKLQPPKTGGKAAHADLEKASGAPALDGENAQHNKPIKAAIEAVRTILQQEVGEPALDFQDVTWIARVGWDLVCWAEDEAWEDAGGIYLAVLPDIQKSLDAGDRKAAIAALRAADTIAKAAQAKTTKEATPVDATPEPDDAAVETAPEPEVTTPSATEPQAAKQAIADSEKSNASEVITKAVEAAVKPLRDEIEKLKEKRAAPGGPILGASKLLSAPSEVKAAVIQASLEDLKKAAEEHPDYSVREGARQMLAKLAGEPATV